MSDTDSSSSGFGRHVVVHRIERAAPDVVTALGTAGAATVHEAIGRRGTWVPTSWPVSQDCGSGAAP